jgi:hypothetical protein
VFLLLKIKVFYTKEKDLLRVICAIETGCQISFNLFNISPRCGKLI